MPDFVFNDVQIDGPPERVSELFKQIAFDGYPGTFDFSKVIPMPEGLDLEEQRLSSASSWFGRSIKNWGTKWNNTQDEQVVDAGSSSIRFTTAWEMPHPVFRELSRQYPDLEFHVSWTGEDVGYRTGARTYRSGEVVSEYLPANGSAEARDISRAIRDLRSGERNAVPDLCNLVQEAQKRAAERSPSPPSLRKPPSVRKDSPER